MKKEFKDLSIEDKKEYLYLRAVTSTNCFLYAIFFVMLSTLSSFNNKGVFLYKWALGGGAIFCIVLIILLYYNENKLKKLYGMN